jgi:hypothetical protein
VGIVYTGPYADQLDYYQSHEGYAARRLPTGQLTSTWTYDTRTFTAWVACCACGWQAKTEHPPTDQGEYAARWQWDSEHIQPLIADIATTGWTEWAARTASRAQTVCEHIAAGRYPAAAAVMGRLGRDLAMWQRTTHALLEQEGGTP